MEAMRLSVLLRMVEHDSGLASSSQPDPAISFTTLATAAPLLSSSPPLHAWTLSLYAASWFTMPLTTYHNLCADLSGFVKLSE